MANKYRGEVEFQNSEGQTFLLRLGMNEFIRNQERLNALKGPEHLRATFFVALTAIEGQKELTEDDAGVLLDDVGYEQGRDLLALTKYGAESKKAGDRAKAELEALLAKAEKPAEAPVNPPTASTDSKS